MCRLDLVVVVKVVAVVAVVVVVGRKGTCIYIGV
jgi:hypothetical protein